MTTAHDDMLHPNDPDLTATYEGGYDIAGATTATTKPTHLVDATDAVPSPKAPAEVARVVLAESQRDSHYTLRRWRGSWMRWTGTHWTEQENDVVRSGLYRRLENAKYITNGKEGEPTLKPWTPNSSNIGHLTDAISAFTIVPETVDPGTWIDPDGGTIHGPAVIACANGLIDARTHRLRPSTPAYFGTNAVPFNYQPNAREPREWMRFLRTLWPAENGTDRDEITALQEWFGYVLSGRTDLQKMALIVGPPRCGKGTLARVLTAVVGAANVAAPTLSGLGQNFGLAPLIGKSVAVVGDARFRGKGQTDVVERLLSISGEDVMTVDRKNRDAWTGKIPARFMVLTNELPRFNDASGAIASRFIIFTMTESFLGREDTGLAGRLEAELPGILNWALEGLARITAGGRLTVPQASAEAMLALQELASPITAFTREACDEGVDLTVEKATLYAAYKTWCQENGHHAAALVQFFVDLKAAHPGMRDVRPRTDGKPGPRSVTGLALSAEWKARPVEDRWHHA